MREDTPPSTTLNLREMMGDDFDDVDDLVEITFDDLEQLTDEESSTSSDDTEEFPMEQHVDDAKVVFREHEGSLFCCDIDPKEGSLVVTGGEDEKVYFWDAVDGSTKFVSNVFKDSVIAVGFSHDGKFVAAGDMSGVVIVWKMTATNTPQEVWTDTVDDVLWLKWHHKANVLLCGVNTGEVYMWKMPGGECKLLPGHGFGTEAGLFMPDGKRAVIGYKDGVIKIFDLSTCQAQYCIENPEMGSILCLSSHHDNNMVVAGSVNARVALIATQSGKLQGIFNCIDESSDVVEREGASVESVLFSRDIAMPFVAIATTNTIYIWDFTKQILRHRLEFNEGITRIMWDLQDFLLYVATQEGDLKILDIRSSAIVFEFKGHTSNILDMVLTKDGRRVVTTSDDNSARVFFLGPGVQ